VKTAGNRFYFEEIVANMIDPTNNLQFYAHLLAQCKISMDKSFRAPAGVYFDTYTYGLVINPILFNKFTKKEKVAILIHEAFHIAYNHVTVRKKDDHERWNYATDIAINQLIKDLPKTALHYSQFDLPAGFSAEQYYIALLDNEKYNQKKEQDEKLKKQMEELFEEAIKKGSLDVDSDECFGDGSEIDIPFDIPIDAHDKESEGDEEYRKEVTKNMLEKASEKSRGNEPSDYADMISLYTKKAVVDWRKELRRIVGNKKANKRRTIMRPDRRFPNREEIKGITKDRIFDLIVVMDVSGSMQDKMLADGLNEIKEICKLTNSNLKVIQVDTDIHEVTEVTKTTTKFNRSAHGGTRIYPAIEYIRDNKIDHNAIVIISDMWIESSTEWKIPPKVPCFFLNTSGKDWDGFSKFKNFKNYRI
jgi:predicted metal-dependent peptidase